MNSDFIKILGISVTLFVACLVGFFIGLLIPPPLSTLLSFIVGCSIGFFGTMFSCKVAETYK